MRKKMITPDKKSIKKNLEELFNNYLEEVYEKPEDINAIKRAYYPYKNYVENATAKTGFEYNKQKPYLLAKDLFEKIIIYQR